MRAAQSRTWTRSAAILVPAVALLMLGGRPLPTLIEGTVVDRAADRPIPGATVTLAVRDVRATTDENGTFSFGALQVTEPDTLIVSHPDFARLRLPLGSPFRTGWHLTIHLLPDTVRPAPGQGNASRATGDRS